VLAERAERRARGERVGDERGRRFGQQRLPAVTRSGDPRRTVDVVADVGAVGQDSLAGVDADPDADSSVLVPLRGGEGALGVRGSRDGGPRSLEDDEERIALGADLDAATRRESATEQPAVPFEDLAVPRGPDGLAKLRRAFDVGEQEGDGADG
jgi:hypothetical protein